MQVSSLPYQPGQWAVSMVGHWAQPGQRAVSMVEHWAQPGQRAFSMHWVHNPENLGLNPSHGELPFLVWTPGSKQKQHFLRGGAWRCSIDTDQFAVLHARP